MNLDAGGIKLSFGSHCAMSHKSEGGVDHNRTVT